MGAKARGQGAAKQHRQYSPERLTAILRLLQEQWGHATCELDHRNAYELLVATILSAQSTDARVNLVTPELFRRFPTVADLAAADSAEVETLVRSTGFYRNKTKSIVGMARKVVSDFAGQIPQTMGRLVELPGVARKTANVVLGTAFGIPSGIVVDTHVRRVTQRLGLTTHQDPVKIEADLMDQVPQDRWIDFGHQTIWHGRRICHARKPDCEHCPLAPLCPSSTAGSSP